MSFTLSNLTIEGRTPIPILVDRIQQRIKESREEAGKSKRAVNKAAILIQAWARGFITRRHLKFLNGCATVIQKYYRGYRARNRVALMAKLRYEKAKRNFYNKKATMIQAAWRGFLARKTFNYYKFKKWLNDTMAKNDQTKNKMKEFENEELIRSEKEMIVEYKMWIEYMSTKLHHLIRTKVNPGVYSNLNSTEYSEIEKYLTKFEFSQFVKDLDRERIKTAVAAVFRDKATDDLECTRNRIILKRCLDSFKARFTISNPTL